MFPKVFVSYSHDDIEHKKWVLDLATRLRQNGVDAVIDQWDLQPGDDVPVYMERNLISADRVIMVCTERYIEKANSGSGGVGYEKMIVTAELSRNIESKNVIPIIRQAGTRQVPTFLQTKLYIDFSNNENYEYSYDQLVRSIHDSPLFEKPPIGNNPFDATQSPSPEEHTDSLHETMKIIATAYEGETSQSIRYVTLCKLNLNRRVMSRALFDIQLSEAETRGYIETNSINSVFVKEQGLKYFITHKLDQQ